MTVIEKINHVIKEFFKKNKGVDKIPAKDLMPQFIKAGIFKADHRNGLPIRNLLRKLDGENQLQLIPTLFGDRKETNTNWYFINNSLLKSPETLPKKSLKIPKGIKDNLKKQSVAKHSRTNSDEYYVVDLCDKILQLQGSRQHRFDFLLGDKNKKGSQVKLPVDVYYQTLNCVIEYRENQHTSENKFFDKSEVLTVSGVHRGEQRKLYDQRRRDVLPKHRITLIEIPYHTFDCDRKDKIIRNPEKDEQTIREILSKYFPNLNEVLASKTMD